MHIFDRLANEYEQVVFFTDPPSGLKAVVAIHSTWLGPALGGTRFYPYRNEEAGLEDVIRLARGMTYKSAAAGLDLGGGKAVIFGDPERHKSEQLLRAYGRFVHGLSGRYITAEDVGTTQADMDLIRRETPHVTGVSRSLGGSGDPSAATAYGVLQGMKAVAKHLWGDTSLAGRPVVISGVGKVGFGLARHLVEERAKVTVADLNSPASERARRDLGVDVVSADRAHMVECDIFSPCALGAILNADTIPQLACHAVVGSANNQLATPSDAKALVEARITYAPDFVVNAGGVINIAEELVGYHRERAYANVRRIYDTTAAVLTTAAAEGITTADAADRLAERRLDAIGRTKLIRT